MTAAPLFLGIDAGTSTMKAALFDARGIIQALDHQEYTLLTPAPGWVELPPETYWQTCVQAIRNLLAKCQAKPEEIACLCISSQGETLICLDRQGSPLRNAIVWLDNRAVNEARRIAAEFSDRKLYHTTGQPQVTPALPASTMLWLQHNQPEIFRLTRHFCLLEDYLLYRLTGRHVTSTALQTSSLLLNIHKRQWWLPMLDFVQVDPSRLGELVEPGVSVGKIGPAAAAETGLSVNTQAVSGGMDQVVGAVGAGNIAPGKITAMIGSALAIVATLARPLFDPLERIPCHCHAAFDRYCLLPWAQTAGMALKWFRDTFFTAEAHQARASGEDIYAQMTGPAADIPPGCEGMTALPHLEGAICPEFNPHARGVFFGATLRHSRAHFVRAILESVAFMLRRNLEVIEQLGGAVEEITLMGGGARSPLWVQIKANVLQKPIRVLRSAEIGCLGAAILGTVAHGTHTNLPAAMAAMTPVSDIIQPDRQTADVYTQAYLRYIALYDLLLPLFRPQKEVSDGTTRH